MRCTKHEPVPLFVEPAPGTPEMVRYVVRRLGDHVKCAKCGAHGRVSAFGKLKWYTGQMIGAMPQERERTQKQADEWNKGAS